MTMECLAEKEGRGRVTIWKERGKEGGEKEGWEFGREDEMRVLQIKKKGRSGGWWKKEERWVEGRLLGIDVKRREERECDVRRWERETRKEENKHREEKKKEEGGPREVGGWREGGEKGKRKKRINYKRERTREVRGSVKKGFEESCCWWKWSSEMIDSEQFFIFKFHLIWKFFIIPAD